MIRAGTLRTENSGQVLTQSKAGYGRKIKGEKSQIGLWDFSQVDYKSDSNIKKKVKKGILFRRRKNFITSFSG